MGPSESKSQDYQNRKEVVIVTPVPGLSIVIGKPSQWIQNRSSELFGILNDEGKAEYIIVNADRGNSTVSGEYDQLIQNWSRELFRISNDEVLKQGIAKIHGKDPLDVFLKSPTPWGDLYKTYNWPQTKVLIKPTVQKEFKENGKGDYVATSLIFENTRNGNAWVTHSLTYSLTNTCTSTWDRNFGLELKTGIEIKIFSAGLTCSATFGHSETTSESQTIMSTTEVKLELKPKEKVLVEIQTLKTSGSTEIKYDVSAEGSVAANYYPKYKDHHFWQFDLNRVLEAMVLPTKRTWVQKINTSFHQSTTVVVKDFKSRAILKSIPIERKSISISLI